MEHHSFVRWALAALAVGCSSGDRSPAIYLDDGGALRHEVLSFSIRLNDQLLADGWRFQAERVSGSEKTYSFFLLPPGVQSFELPASVQDQPLPLQVYAYSDEAGSASDRMTWANELSAAFESGLSSSPERSQFSPLQIHGFEGLELVMIGTREEGPARAYLYAARVDGPETVVDFRGGMTTSAIPDSISAAGISSLADREFEQILGPYRAIVGSLGFDQ